MRRGTASSMRTAPHWCELTNVRFFFTPPGASRGGDFVRACYSSSSSLMRALRDRPALSKCPSIRLSVFSNRSFTAVKPSRISVRTESNSLLIIRASFSISDSLSRWAVSQIWMRFAGAALPLGEARLCGRGRWRGSGRPSPPGLLAAARFVRAKTVPAWPGRNALRPPSARSHSARRAETPRCVDTWGRALRRDSGARGALLP